MFSYGKFQLKITDADIPGLLNKLHTTQIPLEDICIQDVLTALITVRSKDYKRISDYFLRRKIDFQVIASKSASVELKRLLHRPVLWITVLLILVLTLYLPGRVLFIRVSGNETVTEKEILEKAADCGISFGVSTSQIRSEKVKNALLERMDSLQWAAVNTKGCVATISVKEKPYSEKKEERQGPGSSIVALKDGLILDVVATTGQAQCASGQAVQAGQVLISGFVDCGKVLKMCHAEGEVIARTQRNVSLIAPRDYIKRGEMTQSLVRYYLRIGKKLINIYGNCGISPVGCVKIYEEFDMQLPGNHVLPVCFIKEINYYYDDVEPVQATSHAHSKLQQDGRDYLSAQMIAGIVSSEELCFTCTHFACKMEGSYICEEMIGKRVYVKN